MAVAMARSYSSDYTPGLGTSTCCGCCPKKATHTQKSFMGLNLRATQKGNLKRVREGKDNRKTATEYCMNHALLDERKEGKGERKIGERREGLNKQTLWW